MAPDDVNALSEAILTLHTHPQRCNELGVAARERFMRKFSEPVVAKQFQQLVKSLLDGLE